MFNNIFNNIFNKKNDNVKGKVPDKYKNLTDEELFRFYTEKLFAHAKRMLEECRQPGRIHMMYVPYYPKLKNDIYCKIKKEINGFSLSVGAEREGYDITISNFLCMGSEDEVRAYLEDEKNIDDFISSAQHLSEKFDKKIEDMA